jgi:cobalt-precorrin-5B (C1)-methyltransferase
MLRSGYTTGACAAAAAKAATLLLLHSGFAVRGSEDSQNVEIPFPDGSRATFKVHTCAHIVHNAQQSAWASIIKDAGDDPDVTNGAEIVAAVTFLADSAARSNRGTETASVSSPLPSDRFVIKGGKGVGRVTKPGLSMPVGEAAINPVPRKMIQEAVAEALRQAAEPEGNTDGSKAFRGGTSATLEITISVPDGEELTKKTLNARLGIIGGISILGTSGIVKPLSSEAWTASITASMDVARALNLEEIVVSAGRASEKAHMLKYQLPEEAYVMMGDYLEFSLLAAKMHGFARIHLCAQWAKMLKIALSTPHTHVRHGALNVKKALDLLIRLGFDFPEDMECNTAREAFDYIVSAYGFEPSLFRRLCGAAKNYAETITGGIPVVSHLASYRGEILASSE